MIGGSNRGGRRVRRKTQPDQDTSHTQRNSEQGFGGSLAGIAEESAGVRSVNVGAFNGMSELNMAPAAALPLDPALQSSTDAATAGEISHATRESSTGTGIAFNDLQNPSDALGIL